MLHFLDNANPKINDNEVIALIDPDMIFLRPLTLQVKGLENLIPYDHPKFPNPIIPDRYYHHDHDPLHYHYYTIIIIM